MVQHETVRPSAALLLIPSPLLLFQPVQLSDFTDMDFPWKEIFFFIWTHYIVVQYFDPYRLDYHMPYLLYNLVLNYLQ
jgi:hypothetical protein